jgi:hypothetical protein
MSDGAGDEQTTLADFALLIAGEHLSAAGWVL